MVSFIINIPVVNVIYLENEIICVQLKLDVKLVFHSNHVWGKCIGTPNRALSSSSLFKGHSNLPTIVSFLEEKKVYK